MLLVFPLPPVSIKTSHGKFCRGESIVTLSLPHECRPIKDSSVSNRRSSLCELYSENDVPFSPAEEDLFWVTPGEMSSERIKAGYI
jgi:hypothetical protein